MGEANKWIYFAQFVPTERYGLRELPVTGHLDSSHSYSTRIKLWAASLVVEPQLNSLRRRELMFWTGLELMTRLFVRNDYGRVRRTTPL